MNTTTTLRSQLTPAERALIPAPRTASIALELVSGAAVGAVVGTMGGPLGVVAGALIGSVALTATALAAANGNAARRREDEELDRAIGVIGGNIGEAPSDAPPVEIGAFSRASMGAGGAGSEQPAEGLMQDLDD